MNHWAFVIAAYVLVLGGAALIMLHSFVAMRRAEAEAQALRRE